jgi:predicted CopG family antitoxin
MSKNQVGIGLRRDTYEQLKELKAEGQSFDGVILKLIKNYKATVLNVN